MSQRATSERSRIDASLVTRGLTEPTRSSIWRAVDAILEQGPLGSSATSGRTGLALGYVQSGKTTAITALVAAAADCGYRVIVALLGSTNLLLQQNQARLLDSLGLGSREDYRWVHMTNPSGAAKAKELANWLDRDRVVLVPVLKHAGRLDALAGVLERAVGQSLPVLVVDDEADQASLNTQVNAGTESRTYESIGRLRNAAPQHLYVQFTATPYAPLLLEANDELRPDFVELLHPGPGYTGGREFFVDHADVVVRPIPTLDEQRPKSLPTQLPKSLVDAFANFVAGAALLLARDPTSAPVSMLVHSTQRNDVQARYHFLLQRLLRRWTDTAVVAGEVAALPDEILVERSRIASLGATDVVDAAFLDRAIYVLRETTLWLVNSASDVNKVDWTVAPVHVLVGGNKLDRGFTVEGLTVTYMNRPASEQLDTLEQRARAFGYRGDLLPYCQFFATPRTLKVLREIVDTEYDLRSNLQDWLAEGNQAADWAAHIGLLLPEGTRPTRQNVLTQLAHFNERPGWHQLRRPSLLEEDLATNDELVKAIGLDAAPDQDYGRLSHRTLHLRLGQVVAQLLEPWAGVDFGRSPGWRREELLDLLSRLPNQDNLVPVMLLKHPSGGPREREWDSELGFINLMQGSDPRVRPGQPWYPGDRAIGGVDAEPEQVVVQVHRVTSSQRGLIPALYTLAVHAGRRHVVRKV
jgi:hypothetical protein